MIWNNIWNPVKTPISWLNLSKGFKYESQDISDYQTSTPNPTKLDLEVEKNLNIKLPTWKLDETEEEKFIKWLDEDWIINFSKLINQWYSYNAAKALYENKWKYKDITAEWISKYEKEPSTFRNVIQWIYDSAAWTTAFLDKYVATPIAAWIAKAMPWTDNEKIDQAKEETIQDIDNMKYTDIWWDRDSISYEISNLATDLAQVVTPTPAWKLNLLSKYPKIAKLLQTEKWVKLVTELSKDYPKLSKFFTSVVKWWAEWVKDTVKFNAVNAEWTNLEEAVEWAAVWWVLWAWWQVVSSTLDKAKHFLATNWLMNPSWYKKVMKQLIAEWDNVPWKWQIEDLAQWLLDRDINWNKATILEKLENHWETSYKTLDNLLSSSKTTHWLAEADEALNFLLKDLKGLPWRWDDVANLQKLLDKSWKYSLSDLNKIKRELDNNITMYTKAWDPSSAKMAEWYRNLRKAIKEKIEKEAEREWLWNVKMLNNETQVARWLYEWTFTKKAAEDISDTIYNNFWLGMAWLWGIIWYMNEWDISWAIKYGLGWLLLKSTAVKTKLAKAINKLQWNEKVEISKWIWERWKKALSEKSNKKLAEVIEKNPGIMDTIKSTLFDMMVSWTRIGWQKAVEEIVWE